MTDIASLGFNIDTQPLVRANTELMTLIKNASLAEKQIANLGTASAGIGTKVASNINAANTAFRQMAAGATSAASSVARANAQAAASATQTAAAYTNAAAAAQRAAAAQASAAAASARAAAAARNHATGVNALGTAANGARVGLTGLGSSATAATASISGLYTGMAALVALILGGAIVKAADNFTQLNNAIKLAGVTGSDTAIVQKRLFDTANQNGVAISGLTTLYRRGSITAAELGKSQNDLLKVVEVVASALRLQGSSADSAKGALLQLGQSFGTGVVHAEEYNSLLENAYPLLQAAARGMDSMNGSVAKLTNAVKAGQVSSKAFFEAIMKGGDSIIEQSKTMRLTVGNAWEVVVNGFTDFIGKVSDWTNIGRDFSALLVSIGSGLSKLGDNKELLSKISDVFDAMSYSVKAVWDGVVGLGESLNKAFGPALIEALNQTLQTLRFIADVIGATLKAVGIAMESGAAWIREQRADAVNNAVNNQLKAANMAKANTLGEDGNIAFWQQRVDAGIGGANAVRQLEDAKNRKSALILKFEQENAQLQVLVKQREEILNPPKRMAVDGLYAEGAAAATGGGHLADKGTAVEITKANKGLENSYRKIIQSALDYIALKGKETEAVGMNIDKANALTHTQELVNKALMAGIKVTPELAAKYADLGQKMADADEKLKSAEFLRKSQLGAEAFIKNQEIERDALFMSAEAAAAYRKEQELLNAAKVAGLKITEPMKAELHDIAVRTAAAAQETKNYSDAMQFLKSTASEALSGIFQALVKGQSVWDAFANAASRALDRIISKLADLAVESIFDGGSSGGGFFKAIGGIFSGRASSNATGTAGGGGLGSIFGGQGGGGFGSLFSNLGDSLSGMWNQTSNWFSSLVGIDNMSQAGQAGSAFFGPVAPSSGIFGSGISGMGALGAGLGVFGGISTLMKGGGIGNTLGGIGQMVGALVSLIPGIGQIAGPIISILSSVLPGIFGGTKPTEYSFGYDAINYDASKGGYTYSMGNWGPNNQAMNVGNTGMSALGRAITDITGMFNTGSLMGNGIVDPSKMWGVSVGSRFEKYGDGSTFSNQTSYIIDPKTGRQIQWGQGSNEHDVGIETAGMKAAINSILDGAVGQISDNMRAALGNFKFDTGAMKNFEATFEGLGQAISFVMNTYDELGKPILQTKNALMDLRGQFQQVASKATDLGLSLDPINEAFGKARQDTADSFLHDFRAWQDPLTVGLADMAKAAKQANDEIQYLIDQGLASSDDLVTAQNYYLEQTKKLQEQIYGIALSDIADLIKRLTTGDLSGATGTTQFSAAHTAFQDDVTKALAGDTEASARILNEAVQLANLGQAQYGSGQKYQDLRAEITAALQAIQAMVGNTGTGPNPTDPEDGVVTPEQQMIHELQSSLASSNAQIAVLVDKLNKLTDLMQRSVTNT